MSDDDDDDDDGDDNDDDDNDDDDDDGDDGVDDNDVGGGDITGLIIWGGRWDIPVDWASFIIAATI